VVIVCALTELKVYFESVVNTSSLTIFGHNFIFFPEIFLHCRVWTFHLSYRPHEWFWM